MAYEYCILINDTMNPCKLLSFPCPNSCTVTRYAILSTTILMSPPTLTALALSVVASLIVQTTSCSDDIFSARPDANIPCDFLHFVTNLQLNKTLISAESIHNVGQLQQLVNIHSFRCSWIDLRKRRFSNTWGRGIRWTPIQRRQNRDEWLSWCERDVQGKVP